MNFSRKDQTVTAGLRWALFVVAAVAVAAASCSSGDDVAVAASAEDPALTSAAAAPTTSESATPVPVEETAADDTSADDTSAEEDPPEDGSTITIEGVISFESGSAGEGTFEVTSGSGFLGCESGTIIEYDGRDGLDQQLTCTEGTRAGTFTLAVLPSGGPNHFRSAFDLVAASDDYGDITGSGEWVGNINGDGSGSTITVTGDIAFGEVAKPVSIYPRLVQFRVSQCWEGYSNGLDEYATVGNMMLALDLTTGEVTEHGPPPALCTPWLGDEGIGRRIAHKRNGTTYWFGPLDGDWDVELEFERGATLLSRSLAGNRVLLEEGGELVVRDATTGEPIGAPVAGSFRDSRISRANDMNADETLIAVAGATDDGGGQLIVLDAETAAEVFRIDTVAPVTAVLFDDAAGELVAGLFTGQVVTIDVAAQELVSEVESSARATISAIGVDSDGMTIVYAEGAVELVDRRSGPIGTSIEMRGSVAADIRPGRSIVTVTAAQNHEIYEIDR